MKALFIIVALVIVFGVTVSLTDAGCLFKGGRSGQVMSRIIHREVHRAGGIGLFRARGSCATSATAASCSTSAPVNAPPAKAK